MPGEEVRNKSISKQVDQNYYNGNKLRDRAMAKFKFCVYSLKLPNTKIFGNI